MFESFLLLFICYICLYIYAYIHKDNSIVDVFWGTGFVIIAWCMYMLEGSGALSQMVITLLITVWGIRLTYNIGKKKFTKSGEDPRYKKWRSEWKYFYIRSFFQIYMLQLILMCIVATPIFLTYSSDILYNGGVLIIGTLVSVFGLVYESVGDKQLSDFMKIKKSGEILTTGLRKYHRYPQYFGESVFWFGIAIIVLQGSIWGFIGWAMITILVCFVSGIPMLEKRYEDNKKYAEYSQHTSTFFPEWWR